MDNDDILESAILNALRGSAVCFVGAGFSLGAQSAQGGYLPTTKELAGDIASIAGVEDEADDTSLDALADFCNSVPHYRRELNQLLLRRLTLVTPNQSQESFMEVPWRAVFTTNFDDLIERTSQGGSFFPVTPTSKPNSIPQGKRPVYYLHGRAADLLYGDIDPKLVLSETNYLGLRRRSKDLFAALENEIHTAANVIFVGYSLRDMEIASRLFSIENLASRSIVVSGTDTGRVASARLEKFGTVFPIGLESFVERVGILRSSVNRDDLRARYAFLKQIRPSSPAVALDVDAVDELLLAGRFDYDQYFQQIRSNADSGSQKYCVRRYRLLDEIVNSKSQKNRIILTSDLGNGKSVVLNQLAVEAYVDGYEVFRIESNLEEVFDELNHELSLSRRKVFLIDDYVRNKRAAAFIGARLQGNSLLVMATRGFQDRNDYDSIAVDVGGNLREIDCNTLSGEELDDWNSFLEEWGYWGEQIEFTDAERRSYLENRCGAENRSIVISRFRDSHLSNKIESITEFFLKRNPKLQRAFVGILINALCQKHVEWSRIVTWLDIDEFDLREKVLNSSLFSFVGSSRNWYDFSSTQLADFILSEYDFEIETIVEVYTKIVRETAYSANDRRSGFDAIENLKELMRFRFLTRLLGRRADGQEAILAVYKRLSSVKRIRNNDQFWLQYAMANLEAGDIEKAEQYIKDALGIANRKGVGYNKYQIVDQWIRVRLRKSTDRKKPLNKQELRSALSDLQESLTDRQEFPIHPLRSAEMLYDLVEERADEFDMETVTTLRATIERMKKHLPKKGNLAKSQKGETAAIRSAVNRAAIVLANI